MTAMPEDHGMTLVIFDLDGTLVDSRALIIHNVKIAVDTASLTALIRR